MPIAARKEQCALGVDGARHLEAASQAVHARSCLPGEKCRQSSGRCSGGPQGWPHILIHPTTLGTTESLCKDLQSSPPGHFGGLLPPRRGWACRNRGLRDRGTAQASLASLKSGFLEAEPKTRILVHLSVEKGALRRKGVRETGHEKELSKDVVSAGV